MAKPSDMAEVLIPGTIAERLAVIQECENNHFPTLKNLAHEFATIHNIPEGLAVGFAFGAAALVGSNAAFISALGLAIGMAIQNFPEGVAVSLPLKNVTGSIVKAFLYGMGSGAVEPIFAVIGYFLATSLVAAQPWFLSFAAGAMIFVVIEDLIPDAHLSSHPHLGTWGAMIGFVVMMALDVGLG